MICGAVSTVTVYLTWFWRLRSLPALTSSLRVAGLYSTIALMTAESPFWWREWELRQWESHVQSYTTCLEAIMERVWVTALAKQTTNTLFVQGASGILSVSHAWHTPNMRVLEIWTHVDSLANTRDSPSLSHSLSWHESVRDVYMEIPWLKQEVLSLSSSLEEANKLYSVVITDGQS